MQYRLCSQKSTTLQKGLFHAMLLLSSYHIIRSIKGVSSMEVKLVCQSLYLEAPNYPSMLPLMVTE